MCGPEQESSGTLLTRIQCQAIQFSVHLNFIPFILPSLNLLTICFLAISSKNDSKAIHRILWTWRRDRHWTYIAAYVEHTVECTLDVHWSVHGTLHCTVYSGHTLEYIALHTGVHRTVYWTYGGLYTRRAHMCPTDSCCAACTSGPLASYLAGLSPGHRHSHSLHSFQPLNHWDETFRNNTSTPPSPPNSSSA